MQIPKPLGFEAREVNETEHDGQPARAVRGARVYTTEISDLWDALTNPERIPRWFLPVSGDLRLGGLYQLQGNASGTITRCDPPRSLALTWEFGDSTSWLSVELSEHERGTLLTLTHTMLADEASEPHWAQYGAGATGVGWDLGALGLGLHLENGAPPVAPEALEAWSTSDEGKAFVRESAERWGDAQAASGTEAELARAMAARTASFYIGE